MINGHYLTSMLLHFKTAKSISCRKAQDLMNTYEQVGVTKYGVMDLIVTDNHNIRLKSVFHASMGCMVSYKRLSSSSIFFLVLADFSFFQITSDLSHSMFFLVALWAKYHQHWRFFGGLIIPFKIKVIEKPHPVLLPDLWF